MGWTEEAWYIFQRFSLFLCLKKGLLKQFQTLRYQKTYSWKSRSLKFLLSQELSFLAKPNINHGLVSVNLWVARKRKLSQQSFLMTLLHLGLLGLRLLHPYPDPHTQISELPWWQIELEAVHRCNCIPTFEPHMRMHQLLKGRWVLQMSFTLGFVWLEPTRHLSKSVWVVLSVSISYSVNGVH